jgi:hypothetical protein
MTVPVGGQQLRQQDTLARRHRHVVVAALEAEVPRQSATAGLQLLAVDAGSRASRL